MKKILLLFFISFININAQNRLKVNYSEYINIQIPVKQPNKLFIDLKNEKTVWVENTSAQIWDYDKKKEEKEQIEKGYNNAFSAELGRTIPDDYVLYDYKNRKIEIIEDLGKKVFSVPDTFNELKWNLQKETKTVNNIECFKATTNFRGNDWDVWYAPSIPYPYGPWKLHGLPGLILEAKTKDGYFTFIAEKIDNNYLESELYIPREKILKIISFKEYLEYQDYLFNFLFLGKSAPTPKDVFLNTKEKKFETKANLSWLD
ncbi:GLPGLI family protein (plasmid) [Flavobacterium sp. CBA20B-1]|uniref:GLPGLI family protein n=1 Tax=unclassified Flavobacterium TaxID=196869 RepID=UPI0022253005|nr:MULTISPECIES: GLPGLI family protein [unclassified Flavobacterium]WCM43537.1 GLPGLI family protein [Flavobacterium sp. CBA20B-1]